MTFWTGRIKAVRLSVFCLALLAVILSVPVCAFTIPVEAGSVGTAASEASEEVIMPAIEQSSMSAIVVETSRMRTLYSQNADFRQNVPAAAKLMTALIAAERLLPDTQVTISKIVADAAEDEESSDDVVLVSGDKYPLKYLLNRLLFYDSKAAALAIAEQVSGVEEKFVQQMNAKAVSLQMDGTVFLNCTGDPVMDDITDVGGELPVNLQYTTLNDMVTLVYQAFTNDMLNSILSSPSQLILIGSQPVYMNNTFTGNLRTRSEGMIRSAFACEFANASFLAASGSVNSLGLIAITAGGDPDESANDLMALFSGCGNFYEMTPLVLAEDAYTGFSEQTIDGEVFGLVYKKTVYYVHPKSTDFLKGTTRYKSFGPFSRPIQRSMVVGQVLFDLIDGTTIAVDVVPDRQILSNISIVDQALNQLQNNMNLTITLLIAAAALVLVIFSQVVATLGRLFRLAWLIVLEKRSRSRKR